MADKLRGGTTIGGYLVLHVGNLTKSIVDTLGIDAESLVGKLLAPNSDAVAGYNTDGSYPQLEVGNTWVHSPDAGILAPSNNAGSVGHSNWKFSKGYFNEIYGHLNGTATNSDKLDSLDSTQFLRSDTDDTLSGDITVTGGIIHRNAENNHFHIPSPKEGSYSTTSSTITGALKIKLPVLNINDMYSMWVDIYDYSTNESVSLHVGCYADSVSSNPFALVLSTLPSKDFTVRFGDDGDKSCLWIGETNSTWSYPQVQIRDVQAGYTADSSSWEGSWALSFVTSFGTVDKTISSNYPAAGLLGGLALNPTTTNNSANKVVRTDGSGYVKFNYINSNISSNNTAATNYWYEQSNDGYMRKKSLANVKAEIAGDRVLKSGDAMTGDLLFDTHKGNGIVGLYDSTKFQSVYAMGTSYRMKLDGQSLSAGVGGSNFYGIGWTHSNNSDAQGKKVSGHHAVFVSNGTTGSAIGDHIWTKGNVTSLGTMYASTFSGALSGNASTATDLTNTKKQLHATDALRLSGTTIYLYKGDGTNESIALPAGGVQENTAVTFTSVTAGSFTETSARKYKKDIVPLENCLDVISSMDPVVYTRKDTGDREIGLIADDLVLIREEYVHTVKGEVEGVHYQRIVADLIGAVKELKVEVSVLRTTINDLKE